MPVRSSGFVGRGWAGAAVLVVSVMALASLALTGVADAATPPLSGEKAAFPPFDVRTFPAQLFWLAISFGVLYWLMSTIALPRVGEILKERADKIAADLDQAAGLQAKAEETATAYEKALAEARKNAQSIAQQARDAGAKATQERAKAVESELSAKLDAAEKQIAATKTAAMANVTSLGTDVAVAIVGKLTGKEPSVAEAESAVAQALARG